MPTIPPRGDGPAPPSDNNSVLGLIMAVLAALPPAQLNAILCLLNLLNSLPKERLAALAKAAMPHLTKPEIATLCGVDLRTVQRWKRLKALWPRKADHWRSQHEQWYMPDDPPDLVDTGELSRT